MSHPPSREVQPGSGIWYREIGATAEVTIAREAVGNSLDSSAFGALAQALTFVGQSPDLHSLVLRSRAQNFCSGGNYLDPGVPDVPSPSYSPNLLECLRLWSTRDFPVLAVVDGPARAFGCALALSADISIASHRATFQIPELFGGVVPSVAIAALTTRIPIATLSKLVLGCGTLAAVQAHGEGLITDLVDGDQLQPTVDSYLATWSRLKPDVLRYTCRSIRGMVATTTIDDLVALARDGLHYQLDRFVKGQANQQYLAADGSLADAAGK